MTCGRAGVCQSQASGTCRTAVPATRRPPLLAPLPSSSRCGTCVGGVQAEQAGMAGRSGLLSYVCPCPYSDQEGLVASHPLSRSAGRLTSGVELRGSSHRIQQLTLIACCVHNARPMCESMAHVPRHTWSWPLPVLAPPPRARPPSRPAGSPVVLLRRKPLFAAFACHPCQLLLLLLLLLLPAITSPLLLLLVRVCCCGGCCRVGACAVWGPRSRWGMRRAA